MKNSPTSFIPDSLLSSPSSHLSRSAQRRYHTHTLPHLAPPHSPIDTTPTLYIQPTSPTLSLTITTNSPTPATTVSTAAAAGITDSTAATAGKDEEGRHKQPSEVRHTELSQHTPTLNIQHTTKPIDIPQTLSSVSTFPSSPPYQLNPSAPPATTSYPDATGEPTQRGHNAMETSADPAPSSGHKCYATLTSAQKAPQPRHCDDANCPPGGPQVLLINAILQWTPLKRPAQPLTLKKPMYRLLHPSIHIRSPLMPLHLPPSALLSPHLFRFLTLLSFLSLTLPYHLENHHPPSQQIMITP